MTGTRTAQDVGRLIRQLGGQRFRQLARVGALSHRRVLSFSTPLGRPPKKDDDPLYNFNTSLNFADADSEADEYRTVTAAQLVHHRQPPIRVKMLVRDFIDDSLYNPHYGYFSVNATIFSPPSDAGYDFSRFRDTAEFQEEVGARYAAEYNQEVEVVAQIRRRSSGKDKGKGKEVDRPIEVRGGLSRQVWHTPTELFKPYYAQSLTSAILQSYRRNQYPYSDLVIYEVGAGNGSFMIDSLQYIRQTAPDIFDKMKYRIIEISPMLANRQRDRAAKAGLGHKVEVINQDFLQWAGPTGPGEAEEACYVVALEVFDNLSHDMIRYSNDDLTPLQAYVTIDGAGDFALLYQQVSDPLIQRYLSLRSSLPDSTSTSPPIPRHLLFSSIWRKIYANLPFAPNLSKPEYIPTKALLFLEQLRRRLPAHRLLVADFNQLPDAVKGRNGPVVQTRFRSQMVPCGTFLVKQGYFDIFFPTDFELLKSIYGLVMTSPTSPAPGHEGLTSPSPLRGQKAQSNKVEDAFFSPSTSPSGTIRAFKRRNINVYSHESFLQQYGGPEIVAKTTTGDGTWVMGQMYKNAKIMF